MSIYRAQLRKNASNALTLRMSGIQICLPVPTKLFGVNSWIPQMIRKWIPDCWSGDRICTGPILLHRRSCSFFFFLDLEVVTANAHLQFDAYALPLNCLCREVRTIMRTKIMTSTISPIPKLLTDAPTKNENDTAHMVVRNRSRKKMENLTTLNCSPYTTTQQRYHGSHTAIRRVSYLIYVSMRHYVLTTSGDIVVCFHTAVCLSC